MIIAMLIFRYYKLQFMQDKVQKHPSISKQQNKDPSEQTITINRVQSNGQIEIRYQNHHSYPRIQFSDDNKSTLSMKRTPHFDQQFMRGKSMRQETSKSLPKRQQIPHKKVLVLYASGSSGADDHLYVNKGFLKEKIRSNQYLCDERIMQTQDECPDEFLITPEQENGMRIFYSIYEFPKIMQSINMGIDEIRQIAEKIFENYQKFDSFIVLCGFDVICHVATLISFMFENLSKLIIFTGGYFPISYMRNDIMNNLNESFSIISLADRFNDVIIVCKNKGYRGNRSIRIIQGDFGSVGSPNIEALVSVNIKIKFREYLYLPVPTEEFRIWTNLSCRVGIIKFHILLNAEALQYELLNPSFDGFVIESYGSSNIPLKVEIWEIFKKVAEEKGKIFVNVAQPVKKENSSMMKQFLQKYYIYFGGDMTTEAALSKLSYLLSKKYSRPEIKKLLYTNMRGELTEMRSDVQFEVRHPSFMELVQQSLHHYYPSNFYKDFVCEIKNQLALSAQTSSQFQQIFKRVKEKQNGAEQEFRSNMVQLIDENNLLHKAVRASNQNLYNFFLSFPIDCNKQDENECSPLFYAIVKKDKKAIQYLLRRNCQIICNQDDLFSSIVQQLKQDNASFFQMLYHVEFKDTLRDVTNYEGRNTLHLSVLLKAQKCMRFLLQKFKFNLKQKDNYGKTYADYLAASK